MEQVTCRLNMDIHIMENGKMIKNLEKDMKHFQMDKNIKLLMNRVENLVMENIKKVKLQIGQIAHGIMIY